jgi:hypothetical protein
VNNEKMMFLLLIPSINFFIISHISLVDAFSMNRRHVLLLVSCSIGTPIESSAACLQGDLSASCIGVYKVPMDDNINKMISTKEALQIYAPGINYVPPIPSPTSINDAYDAILAQRLAADDIVVVVAAGRLEEAGIKVLNLIPRLTVSGRVLVNNGYFVDSVANENIQYLSRQRIQNLFEVAEVAWKNVDVLIGQGIRGDLGVSAVAQLQILVELRDATAALDDFLVAVQRR